MKIVRVAKKDDNNVVVYLDNDEKLFLSYEVFLKNGLRKNVEIPDGHFDFLIEENQKYHIKKRAYSYIARRHHSVFEIRTKLRRKKYDNKLIEEVLTELVAGGYLNDEEFSEIFADENIRLKLWGRNKVKAELMKRGVNSGVIDIALNKMFPDGNDVGNAIELVRKKYRLLKDRTPDEMKLKQKLYTFLSSRGYDYESSKEAVNSVINESSTNK
jgi:regulatory protein